MFLTQILFCNGLKEGGGAYSEGSAYSGWGKALREKWSLGVRLFRGRRLFGWGALIWENTVIKLVKFFKFYKHTFKSGA